jgi:TolA-binding protein
MQGCRVLALICAFGVASASSAAAPANLLDRANRAFLAGDYDEALSLFDEVGKDKRLPEAEDASYFAARCLLRMNEPEHAEARLQSFLAQYPHSRWCDDALMDLGAIDGSDTVHQNLRAAAARYEYLLQNYASSNRIDDALVELGNAYVKLEEWKKAEKTFYDLLSRARTDEQEVRARLLIAALFSADSNPDQDLHRALGEYERFILPKFPKSRQLPAAYFGHAEVRRKLRDYDEAVASYQTIIDRWPQHSLAPLAQSLIAYCHEQEAQFAESRKELETVKSLAATAGSEFNSALAVRNAAIEQKEQIQILSDNTRKDGESVTEFSGGVSVFYAGVQIHSEQARYDAEQRLMTIEGPAQVQIAGRTISTQSQLKLDPERQIIEISKDVRVEPPSSVPSCEGERLHLHLRTAKLSCIQ